MKRLFILAITAITLTTSAALSFGETFVRPKGDSRFRDLSQARQPLPSAELDGEFNTIKNWMNGNITTTLPMPTDTYVDARAYDSLTLAVQAISTLQKTLVISTAMTAPLDLATHVNTTVMILPGGSINIASGKTLTINGPFSAGIFRVFTGSGTVTGLKEARLEWFTPDNTGTTDASIAINSAFAAAEYVTGAGIYKIGAAKVVISKSSDLSGATFNVDGTPAIAVEVSTGNAGNPTTVLSNKTIYLPEIISSKTGTGWTGQGIGLRTVNLSSAAVYFNHIQGFSIGGQITAYVTGNVYNEYHLKHFDNNKINLQLIAGDSNGWVNENNFYGGRLSHNSNEGTNVSGTRHILLSDSSHAVNNNVFHKPSVEGNTPEYHLECWGSANMFISARWEATTPKVAYKGTVNHGGANVIFYGYNSAGIVITNDGVGTKYNQTFTDKGVRLDGSSSTNATLILNNQNSAAAPLLIGLEPAVDVDTTNLSSVYSLILGSQTLRGKRTADAYDRLKLDFVNGRMYLGNASEALTAYLGSYGTDQIRVANGTFRVDGTSAGALIVGTANYLNGSGSPEGVVSAIAGSVYTSSAGGTGTTLYVKRTGSGNTGWSQAAAAATSIAGTPAFVGQIAVVGGIGYLAVGVSSSGDWKQISDVISAGIGSTPSFVGQRAIVSGEVYIAVGTGNSGDWKHMAFVP